MLKYQFYWKFELFENEVLILTKFNEYVASKFYVIKEIPTIDHLPLRQM